MIDALVLVSIEYEPVIRSEFVGIGHRILFRKDLLDDRKECLSLGILDDFCVHGSIVPFLDSEFY